jgi:hypothetical protein
MVIEHTFVTTLDAHEALTAASNLLQSGGFLVKNNSAFQIGTWTDLEVSRGRKTAARAKDATQCPQQLRMEFDRGRVNIAASITPMDRRNRSFRFGGVVLWGVSAMARREGKDRVYGELMMVITQSLESLLVHHMSPEEAQQPWRIVEAQIKDSARRARQRRMVIWFTILGIILALLGFAIFMANR